MRKIFGGTLIAILFTFTGTGNAITFTDVYTPLDGPVFLNNSHKTFDFYHNITPEFQPTSHTVTSANITLKFHDDGFLGILPDWEDESVSFTFDEMDYGTEEIESRLFHLADTISFSISTQLLQSDGKMHVVLEMVEGDVYFDQSTLTATAQATPTATPEPGSLLLLGSGLSGLGFIGRRRLRAGQGQTS